MCVCVCAAAAVWFVVLFVSSFVRIKGLCVLELEWARTRTRYKTKKKKKKKKSNAHQQADNQSRIAVVFSGCLMHWQLQGRSFPRLLPRAKEFQGWKQTAGDQMQCAQASAWAARGSRATRGTGVEQR